MQPTLLQFLRCPYCGAKLRLATKKSKKKDILKGADIYCTNPDHRPKYRFKSVVFTVRGFIPDMLTAKIDAGSRLIEKIHNDKRRRLDTTEAKDWLTNNLHISYDKLLKHRTLLRDVTLTLNICSRFGFDEKETRQAISMLGSFLMSSGYKKHVADQMYASSEAISYENYEDMLLRRIMDQLLYDNPVVFIELGSGVGRLLLQYGSCISDNPTAAIPYRRHLRPFYEQDSLTNADNLKLIIGVDFVEKMLRFATRWLRDQGLAKLIRTHRIIQIRAVTQNLNLCFRGSPYEKATKIVAILFQTLGNQIGRDLQIDMLKKAWQLTSPNGILFVSVFNKKSFAAQAPPYYSSIKRSVGNPVICDNGIFFSSKAVYSKWFTEKEIQELFIDAGLKIFTILKDADLPVFSQYKSYLPIKEQSFYKKRGIIGIACSRKDQLSMVKCAMKNHLPISKCSIKNHKK